MLGFSFGGTRKPRQFEYKPRYWDPEKEAREERRRQILGEDYTSDNGHKPGMLILEGRLRRMQHAERTKRGSRTVLLRTAIFVILVFGVLYFMTSYLGLFL
ncbi:MAG: hypothetical protein RR931_06140 [Mucinivorans sp.]